MSIFSLISDFHNVQFSEYNFTIFTSSARELIQFGSTKDSRFFQLTGRDCNIFNENVSEFIFESVNGVAPNTGKDYFAMGINS